MSRPVLLRLTLITAFMAVPPECSGRTWRDATGQYSTEADLVFVTNSRVRLHKADGSIVDVPLNRLSNADQEFLRSLSTEPAGPHVSNTLLTAESTAAVFPGPAWSDFVGLITVTSVAVCYLFLVIGTSVWAFWAYWLDKQLARSGGRRIPELKLLFIAFAGGWPGAFAAQRIFRHKTRKVSFQSAFRKTVVFHLWLVGLVAYLVLR